MTSPAAQTDWLLRLAGLSVILLTIVTWPLWWSFPSPLLPRIPFAHGLTTISGGIDRGSVCVMLFGAGLLVLSSCLLRAGTRGRLHVISNTGQLAVLIGMSLSVLLDQHRLQPWVMQSLLLFTLALFGDSGRLLKSWKWVVCSIYLWSAVSKFDVSFLTHQGPMFLRGMFWPLGIETTQWPLHVQKYCSFMFPGGEMLAGLLLLFPSTRRIGLPVSLVMHAVLLWTVGVGLQHEWGVLIWNIYFMLQNMIIFGPDAGWWRPPVEEILVRVPEGRLFRLLTVFAVSYPALELIDRCDHWPAWSVYSSRPAQVRILIDELASRELPDELKHYLGQAAPLEDFVPFSLDQWSFENRHCPVYPQARYRLALARALLKPYLPPQSLLVEIRETPDRWTGERTVKRLTGMATVDGACSRFLLNTQAR